MCYLPKQMHPVLLVFCSIICGALSASIVINIPISPPEPQKAALMARYIVHNSDWVSVATLSSQDAIKGYPFVSLESMSDGLETQSTGNIYLYICNREDSGRDAETDSRVTIMATLAQSDYCKKANLDPQDPRCSKVMITGKLKEVEKTSPDYEFGQNALFIRHPGMKNWPADHGFYVAKVDIEQIELLDSFGGMKFVTVMDYFNANLTKIMNYGMNFDDNIIIEISNNL
ncbi:hypothetical protein JTB14_016892 [Gonioctena quinquepunctata]|nr:hypothetical protein JTB14_016892 [Gonioctena quinquepunctata]